MTSILGKRKYQTTFPCNSDDILSPENLPTIPTFSKDLFETADGLQQILLWFEEYNKCLLRQQLLSELQEQSTS
jgi:hypothetical protein